MSDRSTFFALVPATLLFSALLALPSSARADANSEIVTATTHAELAGGAPDLNTVHSHLHHALNCLVGPGGNGFDAKELNPCAQSGKGAIPDSTAAAKKKSLETAADKLRAGIGASDLKAAQTAGTEAASILKTK